MPLPDAPQDVEDLIFTPDPEEFTRPMTRRAPPAPRPTTDILAELSRSVPAASPAAQEQSQRPAQPELSPEAREERLNAVLSEIIDDPQAAYRTDAVLYQDFLVRLRMRRLPGPPMAMREFRRRVAISRAGVDKETAETPGWQTALELSVRVSDDLQGVFLLLARAALLAEPCPSDMRIAKAYGTHSARRARRLLCYFEEQGLIVVHSVSPASASSPSRISTCRPRRARPMHRMRNPWNGSTLPNREGRFRRLFPLSLPQAAARSSHTLMSSTIAVTATCMS